MSKRTPSPDLFDEISTQDDDLVILLTGVSSRGRWARLAGSGVDRETGFLTGEAAKHLRSLGISVVEVAPKKSFRDVARASIAEADLDATPADLPTGDSSS